MPRKNNVKSFSVVIFDNFQTTVAFCNNCKKKMDTYRMIRYHFRHNCIVDPKQFTKISKIGRILK